MLTIGLVFPFLQADGVYLPEWWFAAAQMLHMLQLVCARSKRQRDKLNSMSNVYQAFPRSCCDVALACLPEWWFAAAQTLHMLQLVSLVRSARGTS